MGKDPPRPTDGEFYEAQQVKVFFADQWHEGRVVAMSGIGRVRVHFDDKEYEMATSDVRSCQQNAASKKISDSTARGHGAESSTQKKVLPMMITPGMKIEAWYWDRWYGGFVKSPVADGKVWVEMDGVSYHVSITDIRPAEKQRAILPMPKRVAV